MSFVHRAYLFDIEKFTDVFTSQWEHVQRYDHEWLHNTAAAAASQNPRIWDYLEPYHMYSFDLGHESEGYDSLEGRIGFWMGILMACHWERVPTPEDYVMRMKEIIQEAGGDKSLVDELAFGIGPKISDLFDIDSKVKASDWFWGRCITIERVPELHCILRTWSPVVANLSDRHRLVYEAALHMFMEAQSSRRGLFAGATT